MKFLAVFAALIAVACAGKTWTLQDLSQAIDYPYTDPIIKSYLVQALDDMMNNLHAGNQVEYVTVTIPPSSVSMSLNELSDIIQNPYIDHALQPYYEAALNQIMEDLYAEKPEGATPVVMPGLEVCHYSLNEISDAIQDPTTSTEELPYLENALDKIMSALFAGEQMETIIIALPVVEGEASAPSPPSPPSLPVPAASPLVQIIVNVNQ